MPKLKQIDNGDEKYKMTEYILIRKNMATKDFIEAYKDIPKLHTIRGRLLNLFTILECFMKFYLSSKQINIPSNIIDYKGKNGVFNKFLDELKKDRSISKNGLKSFERHFKVITLKRNNFAHGIIYYKNKKKSRPYNVNNVVLNPFSPKALSSKPLKDSLNKNKTVFDQLNKSYEYVINWLKERKILEGVLKAKGFCLLEAESKVNIKKR